MAVVSDRAVPNGDGDAAIREAQVKVTSPPDKANTRPDGPAAIAQPSMQMLAMLSTGFDKILSTGVDNSTRAA